MLLQLKFLNWLGWSDERTSGQTDGRTDGLKGGIKLYLGFMLQLLQVTFLNWLG